MEKLPICRICLAENARMYVVVNSNMRELYERLTDIPFVTQDCRPILACFFCCAKLKQCCRFMRKCLEAEELFAQMMNEDYEPKPLLNQDNLEFGGLVKTATQCISIVDVSLTESIVVKEELPAVCERLDDIIEPKEEHQCDDADEECDLSSPNDFENLVEDPFLMGIKTNVEEHQEVSKQKRRSMETIGTTDAKKPQQHLRRTTLEDSITSDQNTLPFNSKIIPNTGEGTSTSTDKCKKPNYENYECDKCRRIFTAKYGLTRHVCTNIAEKPYKCDTCLRGFRHMSKLRDHVRTHTGERPYKCDICQRSFSLNSILRRHIRTHTDIKYYECDVCQRGFNTKNSLIKHIGAHMRKKPIKCDVCQQCFTTKRKLRDHTFTHTVKKSYKCHICERNFNRKTNLTRHIRTHTGEKPYECEFCQRSFSTSTILKGHVRLHTGEGYNCDICQRHFNKKASLINHIRMHTGDKRFKCEICERCFTLKHTLISHVRTHTGEKPYRCNICHRNFSRKSNLKVHIRTHR